MTAEPMTAEELVADRLLHSEGEPLPEDVAHALIGRLYATIDALTARAEAAEKERGAALAQVEVLRGALRALNPNFDELAWALCRQSNPDINPNDVVSINGGPMDRAWRAYIPAAMSVLDVVNATTAPPIPENRDTRPANCRQRLIDEGKPYGRSTCQSCGSILRGVPDRCRTPENRGQDAPNG